MITTGIFKYRYTLDKVKIGLNFLGIAIAADKLWKVPHGVDRHAADRPGTRPKGAIKFFRNPYIRVNVVITNYGLCH